MRAWTFRLQSRCHSGFGAVVSEKPLTAWRQPQRRVLLRRDPSLLEAAACCGDSHVLGYAVTLPTTRLRLQEAASRGDVLQVSVKVGCGISRHTAER